MSLNKISLKTYGLSGIVMILFGLLATYLPQNSKSNDHSDIYFGMPVNQASVQHEFFNDPNFKVKQLNGVKIVDRNTGKFTFYFEYIANKQDTLRRIASLPFLKDNRISSTACELMNAQLNPLENSDLPREERDATSFFWDARADEFVFYECHKSPWKHTVLLSKTSDRILHKIEFV